MKTDVDPIAEAFHAVYEAVVETAPTGPSWDEITTAPAPLQTGAAPRPLESKRRVRWLHPTVVAAAGTLLLFGGIAFLLRGSPDPIGPVGSTPPTSVAPQVAPSVPDVTTATTVVAPLAVVPGNWARVDLDSATFPSGFGDVIAGPDSFVAVGLPGAGISPDGLTWHLASPDLVAVDVASGDGAFVAFDRSGSEAAMWTSPDGTVWTRVPLDEAVFAFGDEINAVAYGDGGWVAVGMDNPNSGQDSPIWTSPDGTTWSRVPFDRAVFGGEMLDVVYGDDGYVAVGRTTSNDGRAEAAVWTSPDGWVWEQVPNATGVFGGVGGYAMYGVTFGDGRYVAVGVEGDADADFLGWHAAVWISTNGVNWTRVPHDSEVFGFRDGEAAVGMDSVAYGTAGYMAVGDAITSDAEIQAAALWYSPDGTTWERVSHDEALFGGNIGLNAVAVIGSNWVAVGREAAITWTWESPD